MNVESTVSLTVVTGPVSKKKAGAFSRIWEHRHIWKFLAMQDLRSRFRRSSFGFIWLIIQQLVFAFGAGWLYATIFHLDIVEFIPRINIGVALWGMLVACFVDASLVYVNAAGYIKQVALPLGIYIARSFMMQLIILGISLCVGLLIIALFGTLHPLYILMALPGVMIYLLFCIGSLGTLALMGARFRDLTHGLSSLFQLLFVLTPILYPASMLESRGLGWAVALNPFAALIEVVRRPLLDGVMPPLWYYGMTVLFAAAAVGVCLFFHHRFAKRVVFWL